MKDGIRAAKQYDAMAEKYSDANDDGVYNSLYERPAMLSILGPLTGARVLDVGCGAGQLSAELADRGASVTGVDVSPAMIEIARGRLGARARFEVADIDDPLPFATDSFDLVVASLVLHYIEDWVPALTEIRRVLTPAGKVTLSTHHPTMDWKLHSPENYFATKQVTETWTKGGSPFDVTYWRRPLTAMSEQFKAAGFAIETLVEPMPDRGLAARDAAQNEYLTTHPHFLLAALVVASA